VVQVTVYIQRITDVDMNECLETCQVGVDLHVLVGMLFMLWVRELIQLMDQAQGFLQIRFSNKGSYLTWRRLSFLLAKFLKVGV